MISADKSIDDIDAVTLYNSPSLGSSHSQSRGLATRGRNSVTQSVVMVTASFNLLLREALSWFLFHKLYRVKFKVVLL